MLPKTKIHAEPHPTPTHSHLEIHPKSETIHSKPNFTLCPNNVIDTWPHLLFKCSHPHIKGLQIARHKKAVHRIAHTLQSNKHTRCYILINVGNEYSRPQDITIPQWLLQCTCPTTSYTCLAKSYWTYYAYKAPHRQLATPPTPSPPNVIPSIEFTYCYDKFPKTTHSEKSTKHNPPIQTLRTTHWQANPLITITTSVRGATHEQPIKDLEGLKAPKN